MLIFNKQYLFLLIVGSISVSVCFLALPRFSANLHYVPVEFAISQYYAGVPIEKNHLEPLIKRASFSLTIDDNVRYLEGLSLLYYLQAKSKGEDSPQGRALLVLSLNTMTSVAQRTPTNSMAWFRLALLDTKLNASTNKICKFIKLSILTGKFDRGLMIARLSLGLINIQGFSAEGQLLLREQVLLAWQFEKDKLLSLISSHTYYWSVIKQLFNTHQTELFNNIEQAIDAKNRVL